MEAVNRQNMLTFWQRERRGRIQLRTIKDIQFIISGTRVFWRKLTTDLDPDGQIEAKNSVFIKFPRVFNAAKFLGGKIDTIWQLSGSQILSVGIRCSENSVNRHHCPLGDLPMLPLLAHCPGSCIACQSQAICAHKAPRTVDETTYHFGRTSLEILLNGILGILKGLLFNFTVMVFAPPPVLLKFLDMLNELIK